MYLALDVGGTKIEVCHLDPSLEIVESVILKTAELPCGSLRFVDALENLIRNSLNPAHSHVCIASKGLIHNGRVIDGSLYGGAVNFPLQDTLAKHLGLPVYLDNDVHPYAYSERQYGAAKNCDNFVIVNIGTGLGVVAFPRKLCRGFKGGAGELSALKRLFPWSNTPQRVEEVVSGQGVANSYYALSGQTIDTATIFNSLATDKTAAIIVDRFIEGMTSLLLDVTYFYNPELIILCGSMTRSSSSFMERLLESYNSRVDPVLAAKDIVISVASHAACRGVVLSYLDSIKDLQLSK